MIVYGDGRAIVTNLSKDGQTWLEGRVPKRRLRLLLAHLLQTGVLRIQTSRTLGVTNEAVHDITVGVAGIARCTTFLWYNEIYQSVAFAAFEHQLRTVLRDVTSGKVW